MVKISTFIKFTNGNDQIASEVFRDIYDVLTNPNRRLMTQMQGMNYLFGNS